MADAVFVQPYTLRALDVDLNGTWRPSAIFTLMQELAEAHAEYHEVGRVHLAESRGLAWVLTRMHLEMDRYPRIGDTIEALTWALEPTSMLFRRHFLFQDAHGIPLGRASSQWILLDLAERTIRRPAAIGGFPFDPDAPIVLPEPRKIRMPDALEEAAVRTVLYSDVDMNGHMNNTKYLNWICELQSTPFLESMQMQSVRIAYIAEAQIDQRITLLCQDSADEVYVRGQTDGNIVFEAHVHWQPR